MFGKNFDHGLCPIGRHQQVEAIRLLAFNQDADMVQRGLRETAAGKGVWRIVQRGYPGQHARRAKSLDLQSDARVRQVRNRKRPIRRNRERVLRLQK